MHKRFDMRPNKVICNQTATLFLQLIAAVIEIPIENFLITGHENRPCRLCGHPYRSGQADQVRRPHGACFDGGQHALCIRIGIAHAVVILVSANTRATRQSSDSVMATLMRS